MTKQRRSSDLLIAAGLLMVTAACGGSSSVTGPDGQAPGAAPATGATIVGTVQAGTATRGEVGASSVSGFRVSVTGTSLETTTDDAGRFTLGGLPSGSVELHFEGSGVDARLEIEGLQDGLTLNITVRVSGSSASRVDDDDDGAEVEFRGTIDSVGTSSLVVEGRTVMVDDDTRILDRDNLPVPLGSLGAGDFVEVEAIAQPDGSLLGKKIELEDGEDEGDDDEGDDVEFVGTVSSTSPLVIGGRDVTTDSSTRYLGHGNETLSAGQVLMVGNRVEVEGHVQTGGSVLAKKIKLED